MKSYSELIGELADRGTTVLLTTHELGEVEGIATHVGILRDGRLVIDESIESLKGRRAADSLRARAGGRRRRAGALRAFGGAQRPARDSRPLSAAT